MKFFDEVFEDKTKFGTKLKTDKYESAGRYAIIDQGQNEIAGYTNLEEGVFTDIPAIIFGDHTRIIKYVNTPFYIGADGVKILKSKDESVNYKYLYYALKNINIPNTGYNRHFKWLKEAKICVPSKEYQDSVVETLDKINEIIIAKKQQLSLLDELIKSRFIELFGTPLLNEKGWKVKNTGDVCSVTDGSHFSPVGKESGYPMLSVRNMRNDGFHYDDCKLVSKEDYDVLVKQGCKPLKNDVLIAKDGSYFYYGFVVKEEIEQAVLSSIAILRPNLEEIHPEYLCRYMLSSEIVDLVGKNYVTGAAIKRVILKGIKQIPVMLPPIDLQNQFAAFVEQTDKSKVKVQQSLDETQILMDSLMQKYFG